MPPDFPLPPPETYSTISPPPSALHHRHTHSPIILSIVAAALALSFFFLFAFAYRKISRKRTVPADLKSPPPPHRFSYSLLRRATDSFSPSNRLGQGGFGSVYKGLLPSGQEVAVKIMDTAGSLQGEREFQNELSLASRVDPTSCPHVVSILGFSSDEKGRRKRLVLVYEYMENGSLQDALMDRKCPELMHWGKRFSILVSIAKGIEYLHSSCDPPIVHGDIKPSNVLLDQNFDAKIADFGLSQSLNREDEGWEDNLGFGNMDEKNGSILEGNETGISEEAAMDAVGSPESCCIKILDEGEEETPLSESEGVLDGVSMDSAISRGNERKDRWWKQQQDNVNGGGSESGRVKDYVMEWMGSEVKKDRPKKDSIEDRKKHKNGKNRKHRKPREWWREEFCDELTKKKKKKRAASNGGESWWQREEEETAPGRKRRRSKGSRGSIDFWIDSLSGEFRIGGGKRNSLDFGNDGNIPKSGGVTSTPSMRGTVCYIAPEYGGGGILSRKCDVYSFGVLLLVLVSGRRPLQVTASPMAEFERANLVSWARQLAHSGKLLDLVDPNIESLDQVQALLCITIGLLCLQRSPNKRPTMKEIVGMLCGDSDPPPLPFEFSPSPPSSFPFKSRRKPR
ncbi:unnamed protein product [Cuscuta epithymum]|uniref:non-specific serine/threonine protein kinase n=1 Tax=Cuscuta epithymum TaxID=186058 RepID=A0AAV0EM40_9ASTE|nr:unnamed protein product [Cuscuta epithymum]